MADRALLARYAGTGLDVSRTIPDWELDILADEVAQLVEAENRRSQELMANAQQSYIEAMPAVGVQQPRDLFSKTNQIPQY